MVAPTHGYLGEGRHAFFLRVRAPKRGDPDEPVVGQDDGHSARKVVKVGLAAAHCRRRDLVQQPYSQLVEEKNKTEES